MREITIRRSDIYLAKLLGGENVLRGIHPVLVISCKKFNSCTTLVNIVPITSTIKGNINNIIVGVESGLLHDSELLCGQVQTINQKRLVKKVGFVRPELMDTVVRTLVKQFSGKNNELSVLQKEKLDYMIKSVKKLMSFKVKYNITDAEIDSQIEGSLSEIKSYFKLLNVEYKSWENLEMFKTYQEKRREIRLARHKKDYKLTSRLSERYLTNLYEMDYTSCGTEAYSEFEWAYYNYALSTKKLGDINKSYNLAKQALTFSIEEDNNRALIYWIIGECCSLKGEDFKKEGIGAFEKCISFYSNINEKKYEILSMFNKAKILRDIPFMKECIENYKVMRQKTVLYSFGDMKDDEVLLELKREVSEII